MVTEGYIWKRGRLHRAWKKRFCRIQKDGRMAYYRSSGASQALRHITLVRSMAEELEDDDEMCGELPSEKFHAFRIVTAMRVFYFCVDSVAERARWIASVNAISSVPAENEAIQQAEWTIACSMEAYPHRPPPTT